VLTGALLNASGATVSADATCEPANSINDVAETANNFLINFRLLSMSCNRPQHNAGKFTVGFLETTTCSRNINSDWGWAWITAAPPEYSSGALCFFDVRIVNYQ
jgi:hypothetical protein